MRKLKRHATGSAGCLKGLWILSALLALASAGGVVYLTLRIEAGEHAFTAGKQTLTEESPALVAGTAKLEAGKQELAEGRADYKEAKDKWHLVWLDRVFRGGRGFREAEEQIAKGESAVAAGEDKLRAGQERVDAGRLKLKQGRERLTFARQVRAGLAGSALFFTLGFALLRRRRVFPGTG